MKNYLVVALLFGAITVHVSAQTKQEIYTDPNIVWAGIVDIAFIPDADTLKKEIQTIVNLYGEEEQVSVVRTPDEDVIDYHRGMKIGGLYHHFVQSLKTTETTPKLRTAILRHAGGKLELYANADFDYKLHYQELPLREMVIDPATFGEEGKLLPESLFEVLKMRCYIYYRKDDMNFHLEPLAVQVLRTEHGDDLGLEVGYLSVGWMSVADGQKDFLLSKDVTWARRIFRAISFNDVYAFKREWDIKKVLESLTENIRTRPDEFKLYRDLGFFSEELMEKSEKKQVGAEEVLVFDPNTFEEMYEYAPWDMSNFEGITFTFDWAWNNATKTVHFQQKAFAPIFKKYREGNDKLLLFLPAFDKRLE